MSELSPIKVAIRLRPIIQREKDENCPICWTPSGDQVISPYASRPTSFTFDTVFGEQATNADVFEKVVRPVIDDFLDGYNGTVFAYGQTASGKTHTMMGNEMSPGIIPMTVNYIFQFIEATPGRTYLLRFSVIEIYNEVVTDLLTNDPISLKIYEDRDGMTVIANLTERVVTSRDELLGALIEGERRRHTGETCMNEKSSRSHTICKMTIESHGCNLIDDKRDTSVTVSHLNLVDLAGSEKCGQLDYKAPRFKEGCNINRSLLVLSTVICKLSEGNSHHISYRESKLTRILKSSLGGNSKTTIICNITPVAYEEGLSTLKFAERAKVVKNKPKLNAILDENSLLKCYENQIQQLEMKLKSTQCEQEKLQEQNIYINQLQEQNSYINQLQEKLRTISDKLLVSSRPFGLPLTFAAQSRRETWGCVSTFKSCASGNIIKSDFPAMFNKSLSQPSINFEQQGHLNTHDESREDFGDGNRELFEELNAVKEELALKTGMLDDFTGRITQFLKEEFGWEEGEDNLFNGQAYLRKETTIVTKSENYSHGCSKCAEEKEKFDKQEKDFLQQIAEFNMNADEHAEIVDQYTDRIQHLENEIQSLQHEQEENERAREERLKECSNYNEKVRELIVSLEIQIKKEYKENDQKSLEKCQTIRELQNEIESMRKEQSTKECENQSKELMKVQNEFVDLKEKYTLLVEELRSSNETAVEKESLQKELVELRQNYSNLQSSYNTEVVRSLVNELIENLATDGEVHEDQSDHRSRISEMEKVLCNLQTVNCNKEPLVDYKVQVLELQETNQIAEEIISDLKSDLVKTLEEVDAKDEEILKLKELLVETQEQREKKAEKDENIEMLLELKQQNSDLKKEFGELKAEVVERVQRGVEAESKYETELNHLLETLDQLKKEVENRKTIQMALENQHSTTNEENANLRNQLEELNSKVNERSQLANDVHSKHEIELKQLLGDLDQLKKKLENGEAIQMKLHNQCSTLEEENANLQIQVEELNAKITERSQLADDVQSKHEIELDQLKKELENAETIQMTLNNQCSAVEEENVNLRNQLGELSAKVSERSQLADDAQSKHEIELKQLLGDLDQLKKELENRETNQKTLENQHSEIKEENVRLLLQIAELSVETVGLAECVQMSTDMTLEKQYREMINENTKLQNQIEILKQGIDEKVRCADESQSKLQTELTQMRETNAELLHRVNHLDHFLIQNEIESQKKLLEVERRHYSKKEQIEDYENQIFELLEEHQQRSEKMNTMAIELKELSSTLEQNKTLMSELEHNYKTCSHELSAKTSELESCVELTSKLERDYDALTRELSTKTSELERCTELMNELKQTHELRIGELSEKSDEQDTTKKIMKKGFEDLKLRMDHLQTAVVKNESDASKQPVTKLEEDLKNQTDKLVESNHKNSILKEKIEVLETRWQQCVRENEESEVKSGNLTKQIQDLEAKNLILADDVTRLSNRIEGLNTEKMDLKKELDNAVSLRFKEHKEIQQNQITVETLKDRITVFADRITVLETENTDLEQEIVTLKNQRFSQQSTTEEVEKKILEERLSALELTHEELVLKLTTDHEKKIDELKTHHKMKESEMIERIKYLENHANEIEKIVNESEQKLWAMVDGEKAKHKKTKSELEAVKKLLENSQQTRTPLHPIPQNNVSNVLIDKEELHSKLEELTRLNNEVQKELSIRKTQQVSQENDLHLMDSNTELLRKECEINALKIELNKRDSPLIAKIELLTKERDSCKKRENEMKQHLIKMQKQTFNSTTNEFQRVGGTTPVAPNFGIVDSFKIELLEDQLRKLHRQLEKCVCNAQK